jgi:hypothetical protein
MVGNMENIAILMAGKWNILKAGKLIFMENIDGGQYGKYCYIGVVAIPRFFAPRIIRG